MALIQAKAIVVGVLASIFAMVMDWILEGKFSVYHALLLCAASMGTVALVSVVLVTPRPIKDGGKEGFQQPRIPKLAQTMAGRLYHKESSPSLCQSDEWHSKGDTE
ncbi:S41A1-like protein [Mya arenaria]|uniref:S41A1-like protein n=1 Tax=Mya arenaria TaxID=6604 RepID=A0ABY7G793_MYAAR|nr:S41A1-like protein [Mya arenaria]